MAVKKTTHHHQVTFDFPIKSIIPGSAEDFLLIETTDTQKKEQAFLLLSIKKMEIIKAIAFGPDYSGLVVKSYDNHRLLLIQYSNQNNPDETNIFTFNWDGGDPILSLHNTRIIQSGTGWIQVPHPHFANKEIYLDLASGGELKTAPSSEPADTMHDMAYASRYASSSEYFQWFEQYFSKHNILPCRQIEYLKTKRRILISFYEEKGDDLTNSLAVIDDKGLMLECILLDDRLPGVGKDTFFVYRNKAIFVTQKRTLNIYDL